MGNIVLVSILFTMVLTPIISRVYKGSLTLRYPPKYQYLTNMIILAPNVGVDYALGGGSVLLEYQYTCKQMIGYFKNMGGEIYKWT